VELQRRDPSFDALLGPRVTASDLAFMRIRGTDRFTRSEGVRAIGAAARGDEVKRFEWLFRRSDELTDREVEGGGYATPLRLTEAASSELRLEVRGEELFRASADEGAAPGARNPGRTSGTTCKPSDS
jgi:hypothetical protein